MQIFVATEILVFDFELFIGGWAKKDYSKHTMADGDLPMCRSHFHALPSSSERAVYRL